MMRTAVTCDACEKEVGDPPPGSRPNFVPVCLSLTRRSDGKHVNLVVPGDTAQAELCLDCALGADVALTRFFIAAGDA